MNLELLLIRNLGKLLNFSESQFPSYKKEVMSTHRFLVRLDEMKFVKASQGRVSSTQVLLQCDFKLRNPRSESNLKFGDSQRDEGADGSVIRSFPNAKQRMANNSAQKQV